MYTKIFLSLSLFGVVNLAQAQEQQQQVDVQALKAQLEQQKNDLLNQEQEILRQMNGSTTVSVTRSVPAAPAPVAVKEEAATSKAEPEVDNEKIQLAEKNKNLEASLGKAQDRARKLEADLKEAKNRLMLAETEVERLSQILENRNKIALKGPGKEAEIAVPSKVSLVAPNRETSAADDMPVATVIANKANLRVGPSLTDSPLMTVSKGTRLVVEKRTKDWYRIITPTGTRAWVASDVVAFGPDSQSSPSKVVSIKGYRAGE